MYKAGLSFLARNWPFANGSGSLIHYLGRNLDVGQGEVTCRTSDGFGMTVLANDLIGRHIIMTGAFDRSGVGALLRFAEPGDFCSDVGANIGYVSCVLLANVPGLTISCVEPQPLVVDLLRKNVSQFGDDRAHVLQAALSAKKSEGYLQLDRANRGGSKLVEGSSEGTVEVPLVGAADYFGAFDRLDLIKMDIEGHESIVFEAASAELERLQPKAILYEDVLRTSGPGERINTILQDLGYRIFGLDKRLLRTNLTPVTRENAGSFLDFVAVSTRRDIPQAARQAFDLTLG